MTFEPVLHILITIISEWKREITSKRKTGEEVLDTINSPERAKIRLKTVEVTPYSNDEIV